MPTLHHFVLDPFSRRIRLALAEYGDSITLVDAEPWGDMGQLTGLNPAGSVPILVEDDGSIICGLEALTEYLEETRKNRLSLIQGDALARAEVRRLIGWFDTKFYAEVSEPLLTEKIIRRFLPRERGGGPPDVQRFRHVTGLICAHLDYLGGMAEARGWLAGPELSMADLAAAAHISVVDFLGAIPWAELPLARSWYQRIKSRPSFRPLLGDTLRGVTPPSAYADLDF